MAVKYGIDSEREKWAQVCRSKEPSLKRRTELLKQLPDATFEIDTEKGFASNILSINMDDVIAKSNDLISKSNMLFQKTSKPFLKLDFFTPRDLTIDSPFIKLVLNRQLVSAISKYLGHIPVLHSCGLWYSKHTNQELMASQLFHCDWEDIKCVSIFANINDIEDLQGPFTFIPADHSKKIRDNIQYPYGPDIYYLPDEQIFNMYPEEQCVKFTGKAGTIGLIDNCRCFHQGSRVIGEQPRITIVAKFLSPAAFNVNSEQTQFEHLVNNSLDEIDRLILSKK